MDGQDIRIRFDLVESIGLLNPFRQPDIGLCLQGCVQIGNIVHGESLRQASANGSVYYAFVDDRAVGKTVLVALGGILSVHHAAMARIDYWDPARHICGGLDGEF